MARILLERLLVALLLIPVGCGGSDDAYDADNNRDAGNHESTKDAGRSADAADRDRAPIDSGVEDANDSSVDEIPAACSSEVCDLLAADSCGEEQACKFLIPIDGSSTPSAQCQPAGELGEGDFCSTTAECGPGLDCTVDCDPEALDCEAEENWGVCRNYCCALNSTSRCPQKQACLIELTDAEGGRTGVGLCDRCDDCSPLIAGDCDSGQGCYLLPDEDRGGISLCFLCMESESALSEGARCETANDCSPGLGCFSIDRQPNTCTRFCDLTSGIDVCQPEGQCQDYLGEASREGTLGICIPII
jgi:hypothetical protein